MVQLMGHNMMRKDGPDHMAERKTIFPAVSPKTVKNVWKTEFEGSQILFWKMSNQRGAGI